MNRRVLFFIFQRIDLYPPCISEVFMLNDMGIEVAILTKGCNEQLMAQFQERGIACHILEVKKNKNKYIQKIRNYLNYRHRFQWFFRKYWHQNSVLWVGTEESIIKMWPFLKKKHPCVLNVLEFYEKDDYQKKMKQIAPKMDVLTACESHRAQYMMDWWQLKKKPYIMPNKPYRQSDINTMGSTPEIRKAIACMKGKKVLLYQGIIDSDRDLSFLAKALKQADSDYYLMLLGKDYHDSVRLITEIYEKTIYLGYFPAPLHLELTSSATIGVAYYEDTCINNRYCAPNKIYEYAGCGLPMLCNTVPGLTETVGKAGAAECVDFHDAESVIRAIEKIDTHYEDYCQAAKRFYDETDNTLIMKDIIEKVFK